MQYAKAKSVSKSVIGRGPQLKDLILNTLETCANVVGSTLGPGGMSVIIERQEENLPPIVTKDGVTVFKNLGFEDSGAHVLMEAARDAAIRTASTAGDGTTTATLLAYAIVKATMDFCEKNPKYSPQRAVRTVQKYFNVDIEPFIRGEATKVSLAKPEGRAALQAVAKVSANGDVELAQAVMECFNVVGRDGNVTLVEQSGHSRYEVERIEGYSIQGGYEDSCGKMYQGFINDIGKQIVRLEKPLVILYNGRINDTYSALTLLEKIGDAASRGECSHNVVIMANGFSHKFIEDMFVNFQDSRTPNIYPMVVPLTASPTGQFDFLADMRALTGGRIFDPVQETLENAELDQLGQCDAFEANRFRSSLIGYRDEMLIEERVAELKAMLNSDISTMDATLVQERLGKITQGIARLKIIGSSSGELRERRDRAEDAIMAVRGAMAHGVLPAGGKMLLRLAERAMLEQDEVIVAILGKALQYPVERLYQNAGFLWEEYATIKDEMLLNDKSTVYDLLDSKYVDAFESGLLDSTPAVLEALRNAISIATQLGTNGGVIVFKRDHEFERSEAKATTDFLRNASYNPADERY